MAVVTYDFAWDTNCVSWSSVAPPNPQRLAVGSYITDGQNQIGILEKNPNNERLECVGYGRLNYPPTKIAFAPQSVLAGSDKDVMVSSSDFLRLWNINEVPVPPSEAVSNKVGDHPDSQQQDNATTSNNNNNDDDDNNNGEGDSSSTNNNNSKDDKDGNSKKDSSSSSNNEIPARFKAPILSQWKRLNMDLKHSFKPAREDSSSSGSGSGSNNNNNNNPTSSSRQFNPVTHPHLSNEFSEPVTSFDWNVDKPSMVAATSTDTTICVWDIYQQQLLVQLIAHDRAVYDCSFAPGESVFASCGADGSVRVFDLRAMDNCTIVYEEGPAHPMLRVAWSRDSPYIAATIAESPRVIIIDMRNPSTPVCLHANHSAPINSIAWAPQYGHTLCCVGEDQRAMIWDINTEPMSPPTPQMTYDAAEAPINGVSWSKSFEDWVAITFGKKCSLLLV